jgi:hypothetical protein
MFFGSTMLMVTIALVMAVITTNIYNKKDSFHRCPHWVVALASKFYPAHLLPPDRSRPHPHRRGKHSCNGGERGGGRSGDVLAISSDGGAGEIESLTCGCCCHCRKDSVSGIGMYPDIHPSPPANGFDRERVEAEWKMVAKFADRVFFWVFFALSSAVQTILFTQMVPESRFDAGSELDNL